MSDLIRFEIILTRKKSVYFESGSDRFQTILYIILSSLMVHIDGNFFFFFWEKTNQKSMVCDYEDIDHHHYHHHNHDRMMCQMITEFLSPIKDDGIRKKPRNDIEERGKIKANRIDKNRETLSKTTSAIIWPSHTSSEIC